METWSVVFLPKGSELQCRIRQGCVLRLQDGFEGVLHHQSKDLSGFDTALFQLVEELLLDDPVESTWLVWDMLGAHFQSAL